MQDMQFQVLRKAEHILFGLHTEEGKIREVIRYLLEGRSFREAAGSSRN